MRELHVVRKLAEIVRRRWGLDVEFAATSGAEAGDAPCAPIVVEGQAVGAVRTADSTAGATIAGHKLLPPADREYLSELVRVLADEIAGWHTERVERARRTLATAESAGSRYAYRDLVGHSRPMLELYRLLDKVIDSDSTVLVHGENGTGKELIAQAIHHHSRRKGERFVVQNCSALNDNLLDSELFGHKKGSFTGAFADKRGLFEVADRGTFFLDEIGDMSPALQIKLLRVLQEGTFTPVGDTEARHVDVRIIAATNRDLKRMVQRAEFREDLYYRINVISLTVPPLRDRRDDIPALVERFLEDQAAGRRMPTKRLHRACLDRLVAFAWPGNVRELENEIERLVVLSGDERVIGEDLLSPKFLRPTESGAPATLPDAIDALERTMIRDALDRCDGNKTRAAVHLGISRRNLIRKVSRYQIDRARGPAARNPAARR